MAKITYKSSIPNDKPLWLLKLQLAVSQLDATGLKGNEQDFRNLKSFIDAEIRSLMGKGDIRRSFVETELRQDGYACGYCHGNGWFWNPEIIHERVKIPCPKCGGTGHVKGIVTVEWVPDGEVKACFSKKQEI